MWWMAMTTANASVLDVGAGQTWATVSDAVAAAGDGDVIRLHDALVTEDVLVDGKRLTFVGAGATTWRAATWVPLYMAYGADVTVIGLDFDCSSSTAIVAADATLRVVDSSFHGLGSGVLLFAVDASFDRVVFHDLHGDAAISGQPWTVAIDRSLFRDNTSWDSTIHFDSGELRMTRTAMVRNVSHGALAGALTCIADCTVSDSLFMGNEGWSGSAIHVAGSLDLRRTMLCRNDAVAEGTITNLGTSHLVVRDNAFVENTSPWTGAAMAVGGGTLDLRNNAFVGNEATYQGSGGIYVSATTTGTIVNNLFSGNTGTDPVVHLAGASIAPTYGAWWNQVDDASFPLGPTDLVGQDPTLRTQGHPCSWNRVLPAAGSPLVDAGDPSILDRDGSRSDIGVTGGPDAR